MDYVISNCPYKISYVSSLLNDFSLDILGISESWLTPGTPDSYVAIKNFNIVRNDNPQGIRKHGVLVYIRDKVKYNLVPCQLSNVVVVYLCDLDLYIITIYRPPSNSLDENNLIISFLSQFCNDKEVVIQGDFNLPIYI